MSKNNSDSTKSATEDHKDRTSMKHSLSKFEHDLFHEESNIPGNLYRVKKVTMPNNDEKWKLIVGTKTIFVVEGSKLGKKELTFLKSVDGFKFLLSQAKIEVKSLSDFKSNLKKIINSQP